MNEYVSKSESIDLKELYIGGGSTEAPGVLG